MEATSASSISDENKAIFNSITDLVTKPEFMESCYEFMDKHKDTFEDTDENKLEYTPIHEEYIAIL